VLLLHEASLIVGVSGQVNEGLLEDGLAAKRIRVIYNGIDFGRLGRSSTCLRKVLGIPADAFVIATAGSLIARKGHDVLIRAFRQLLPGSQAPHLIIFGDGPDRAVLEGLVRTLDLNARVHFLGHVDDVSQLYQAADVFALASRGDAFGLVCAEAGHFGLPAVSTRVGGIPEVIVHNETGFLVSPGDVEAFARALSLLMADTKLRAQMGQAAAARVNRLFTAERMAREFEEAYTILSAVPKSQLGWISALRRLRPYAKIVGRQLSARTRRML
jgi:glycosyltransferase involved in cell wall biosynthesis